MMIWLSFSDPTRPGGFLGVAIVEVPATAYTPYALSEAILKTRALGVNPGGEVAGFRISPAEEDHYRPHLNRLLTRAEVEVLGEHFTRPQRSPRRKVVTLQRLSICSCGFPLLNEDIGVGAEYEINLDTLRQDGWNLTCGGCGTTHRNVATVLASQIIHPDARPARLPYSVFVGSSLKDGFTK